MRQTSYLAVTVMLVAAVMTFAGCSSVIDNIVDDRVAEAIEEQRKKLPHNLDHGISMTELEYDPETNQITMIYTVPDPNLLDQHFDKIQSKAHRRVRNNGQLQRAMENGVRIFHEFRSTGGSPRRFETK